MARYVSAWRALVGWCVMAWRKCYVVRVFLGEFICGGVQAEGVVEGWVGCRGRLKERGNAFVGILDDGEGGGCGWCVVGEETAGEVSVHIIVGEGAVWVKGDSTRASVVLLPVYKVAGFSRWRQYDFLFSLVGASSFELLCSRGNEGGGGSRGS